MELPHQKTDISSEDFQLLEDLATASWYSDVLFAVVELGICGALAEGACSHEDLAARTGCDPDGLQRLLAAAVALGLIVESGGRFENGPLAARYLVPGAGSYAGDFFRYRRYLTSHWQRLPARVRKGVSANARTREEPREAYLGRVFDYVRAMDIQARIKAADAVEQLGRICTLHPRRILDVGGGAGAWCRAFRRLWPYARTVVYDLPETFSAAGKLYPEPSSWEGIERVGGNALTPCFRRQRFDLVLLSNVLHAYGEREAEQLLKDALTLLAPGGMVLVHDYLSDRQDGGSPHKGRLYDLHMMLNTYNGRVYSSEELTAMLEAAGLRSSRLLHLRSDTSLVLAARDGTGGHQQVALRDMLAARAGKMGFSFARVIDAGEVAVEPWVRLKCRFGCAGYNASLTCPPSSPDDAKMREILSRYTHALLVQGAPPSKEFHDRLLQLERALFLDGHPEALAFGAGPCTVCPQCAPEGPCRFPEKARPSLEACGVDVYETARRAGLLLQPVTHRMGYVKYVGLVLFTAR